MIIVSTFTLVVVVVKSSINIIVKTVFNYEIVLCVDLSYIVMEKISSTDKFKQLKLNIVGPKRIKDSSKHTSIRSNIIRNVNGNREEIKNSFVRESPRRQNVAKKFPFSNLHSSYKPKNGLDGLIKLGQGSILESSAICNANKNIKESNVGTFSSKSERNNALFKQTLEKDSSGFLKPLHPAPSRNLHTRYVNDELKRLNELLPRMLSRNMFHEVEIAYYLENIFNMTKKMAYQSLKKHSSYTSPSPNTSVDRVKLWLQSSLIPTELGMCSMDKSSKRSHPSEIINDESNQGNANFLLKDWTVIKGSSETELLLTGTLINKFNGKVVESNHKSSCVTDNLGENMVKTVCCTYQLCGRFISGEGDIPNYVKKHFIDGKFPDDWRLVASSWHFLNSKNTTLSNKNAEKSKSIKRKRDPYGDKEAADSVMKNNSYQREINRNANTIKNLDQLSSLLNTSVRTRATVLKDKLPIFRPFS